MSIANKFLIIEILIPLLISAVYIPWIIKSDKIDKQFLIPVYVVVMYLCSISVVLNIIGR